MRPFNRGALAELWRGGGAVAVAEPAREAAEGGPVRSWVPPKRWVWLRPEVYPPRPRRQVHREV